jgi:hypothetical protein
MPPDDRRSDRPPTDVVDLRDRSRRRLQSVPTLVGSGPAPGSASAVQFSESVRKVVGVARRHGLRPPVFRSPPRLDGVDRSIRRRADGQVVVAVRRTGRPLAAVRADVIDGVVAANSLRGGDADRFRNAAWAALEPPDRELHRTPAPDPSRAGPTRPVRVA